MAADQRNGSKQRNAAAVAGVALTLASIAAPQLGLPSGVWIGTLVLAAALLVYAAYIQLGFPALRTKTRGKRDLARDLRAWCDQCTGELHRNGIPAPGVDQPVSFAEPNPQAVMDAYYKQGGLRDRVLPLIDRGKELGIMDENVRRRFHAPKHPEDLWGLVQMLWDDYIKPHTEDNQ